MARWWLIVTRSQILISITKERDIPQPYYEDFYVSNTILFPKSLKKSLVADFAECVYKAFIKSNVFSGLPWGHNWTPRAYEGMKELPQTDSE